VPANYTGATTNSSVLYDADLGLNDNAPALASGTHLLAATTWESLAGIGGGSVSSFSANDWSAGDYYQFSAPTTNFDDISISYYQNATSTGPKDWEVEYSTNGSTYTLDATYAITATAANEQFNLSSITALNNDPSIYLRLIVLDGTSVGGGAIGSGGNVRLDDFLISGTLTTGTPASDVWTASNGTGTWDTVTSNWTVSGTANKTYSDFDNVTFDDTHSGTAGGNVSLTGTQVSPSSILVNTASTYTIGGGPILTGSLTKAGTGTLVLTSSNNYGGGTIITGGTVQIDSASELGYVAGAVTIDNNSALALTNTMTSTHPLIGGSNTGRSSPTAIT
jgi:autotransporter-associated beta strand protein